MRAAAEERLNRVEDEFLDASIRVVHVTTDVSDKLVVHHGVRRVVQLPDELRSNATDRAGRLSEMMYMNRLIASEHHHSLSQLRERWVQQQQRLLMGFQQVATTARNQIEAEMAAERISTLQNRLMGSLSADDEVQACKEAGGCTKKTTEHPDPLLKFNHPNVKPIELLSFTGTVSPGPLYRSKETGWRNTMDIELEDVKILGFMLPQIASFSKLPVPKSVFKLCPGARPHPQGENHNFEGKEGKTRVLRNNRVVFVNPDNVKATDTKVGNEPVSKFFPTSCELNLKLVCQRCYAYADADIESEMDFGFSWGGFEIEKFDFKMTGELEIAIVLRLSVDYAFKWEAGEVKALSFSFASLQFFLGAPKLSHALPLF